MTSPNSLLDDQGLRELFSLVGAGSTMTQASKEML
jgi:hypothetical protein